MVHSCDDFVDTQKIAAPAQFAMPGRIKAMTARRKLRTEAAADAPAGALIEALAPLMRVRPVLEDFCRFGGAWRADHAPLGTGCAQFHIVTRGSCRIERPGRAEIALQAGDILLLPHGDSHVVRSRRNGAPPEITVTYHNAIRAKTTVGAEADTELICGRLTFDAGRSTLLSAALPDDIVLRTAHTPVLARLRTLLAEIREELDVGAPGAALIASDLARALFAMMLRLYLEQVPRQGGMLSLLQDRATARVLLALLKQPERDWSLDEMAAAGLTSRASLVRSFRKSCGASPAAFLGDLRLELARQRLVGSDAPIAAIAASVGYNSEAALSRAFMRRFGHRPGAMRQKSR